MFDFKEDRKKTNEKKKLLTGAKAFMILGLILVVLGSFLILPAFAQEVSTITTFQDNLDVFFDFPPHASAFYPVFFMLLSLVLMGYAISHRSDQISAVFSITSFILCLILALMLVSPTEFVSYSTVTTTEIISDPSNDVYTSVKTTETQDNVIPSDPTFRIILSVLFSTFGLFSALFAILTIFYWKTS